MCREIGLLYLQLFVLETYNFPNSVNRVASLHLVLDEFAQNLSGRQLNEKQKSDLSSLMEATRSVLEELGIVIERFTSLGKEQSTIGAKTQKAWKKLRWDQDAIRGFRSRIILNTTMLEAFNSSLVSMTSQTMIENLATMDERMASLQLMNDQHQRLALLEWITSLNFPAQQSAIFSRRQEGTGRWLFDSPEFTTWMNKPKETLLCRGIPGAGKTMLASITIDYLERTFRHKNIPVTYIYCDYRRQQEQTPENLLASILKQLLQHRVLVPEIVMKSYDHHVNSGTRPSLEEIGDMLKDLITSDFRQTYVVVDALDELPVSHQGRQILLANLRSLQKIQNVNFMMTSRFVPQIDHELQDSLFLEIRASNEDIKKYVYGHICDLTTSAQNNSTLQDDIANSIVDVVDGMFLLAQLHMDSLTDKTSAKAIKKALERLPMGSDALDVAYGQAMQRIENQKPGFRILAERTLSWITYACCLLTVTELRHALAIELGVSEFDEDNLDDIKDIVSVCCGLIIIDSEKEAVSFVHYTTQEYFRKAGSHHFPNAQEEIANSCITYLLFREFGEGWVDDDTEGKGWVWDSGGHFHWIASAPVEARIVKYPFLRYAARFWARHAEKCITNIEDRVGKLLLEFLTDDHKVSNAGEIVFRKPGGMVHDDYYLRFKFPPRTPSNTPMFGMHLATYFNFTDCMSKLLEIGLFAADLKDQDGRTPLMWAAHEGHEAAVKLLLGRQDVDVNMIDSNESLGGYPRTALTCAVYYGHVGIVELLLEREDIDVNMRDNKDNRMTPLIWAAVGGYAATLKVLLSHKDIAANGQVSQDDKALLWAAADGHADYVEELLKRADVDPDMIPVLNFRATIRRHTIHAKARRENNKGLLLTE